MAIKIMTVIILQRYGFSPNKQNEEKSFQSPNHLFRHFHDIVHREST